MAKRGSRMTASTLAQRKAALHYIATIRNAAKQAYANHYHMFLLNGTPMPDSQSFNLGSMARQAVEMNLREILA